MVQQPLADEFADLFELDFVGPVHERAMPEHLGAVEFTLQELQRAIGRLKVNKAPDTVGIAVELIPDDFLPCLLDMYNFVLFNGSVPPVWKETVFGMLPQKMRAVQTSDFRPLANTRLFYENTLDLHQPEAQHGFRPNFAWRNIWCLQPCFWIRDGHLAKQFGLLAWICPNTCIGPPYGQHWKHKAFLNI